MKELHRKTFRVTIEIERKFLPNIIKIFRFRQGTVEEVLHMLEWIKGPNDYSDYLFWFLNNKNINNQKISWRQFAKLKDEKIYTIFKGLENTFAKGYFDKSVKVNPNKPFDYKDYAPASSAISSICKMLALDPLKFLQMTWEQVQFMTDGLEWNANEMDKKGQQKNKNKALAQYVNLQFEKK